jgi:mRNA-degrading endonuclease YafQ of YafQ-DinJ toxin-antitoxin module
MKQDLLLIYAVDASKNIILLIETHNKTKGCFIARLSF